MRKGSRYLPSGDHPKQNDSRTSSSDSVIDIPGAGVAQEDSEYETTVLLLPKPAYASSSTAEQRLRANYPQFNYQHVRKVSPKHEHSESISLMTMGSPASQSTLALSEAASAQDKNRKLRKESSRGIMSLFCAQPASARTVSVNDNLENDRRRRRSSEFPPNVVRNQKYSIFTFVPLVLYNQVHKRCAAR